MTMDGRFRRGSHIVIALCHGLRFGFIRRQHQTEGKIERWHQTLKDRIVLENYFMPADLKARIAAFVEHHNHRRYTRTSAISRRPMSTSAAARPSCCKGKGSNARPSTRGDCCIGRQLPKMTNSMGQSLR